MANPLRMFHKSEASDFERLCHEVFTESESGRKLLAALDARYNNVQLFDKDSARATDFALGRRDVVQTFFLSIAKVQTEGVR